MKNSEKVIALTEQVNKYFNQLSNNIPKGFLIVGVCAEDGESLDTMSSGIGMSIDEISHAALTTLLIYKKQRLETHMKN